MLDLLDKIKRLRENSEFDESAHAQFDSWELKIQRAIAREDLKGHFVIKELLATATHKIESINNRLVSESSKDLPDTERDLLIHERNWHRNLIDEFTGASETEAIRQQLEDPYYQ